MARRLPSLMSLVLVVSLWPVFGNAEAPAKKESLPTAEDDYYEFYRTLADAVDQVERNYVTKVSRRELLEAALEGIVGRLDPYSSYIKQDELSNFRTNVENQFGGIGIRISMDSGDLRVLSPLVGTPAYRAGLRPGDRILEIDGEATAGVSLEKAVRRLKGKAGSSVALTIAHPGESTPRTVRLKREVIRIRTVLGDHRNADDSWNYTLDAAGKIGYVRIAAFSGETTAELRAVLEELQRKNVRGLILDLRFNPGGLLSSAIEICDLFIASGKIVSTEGRNSKRRVWRARSEGTFDSFAMVVLVNRYSASASEILSGCLQDHRRAVVVGERTWGKGSVQNVIELQNGKSALKLTTASYQRPSGKKIHRFPDDDEDDPWGVTPNDGFVMGLSDEEVSRLIRHQQQADLAVAGRHVPQRSDGSPPEPDDAPDESSFADRQLQKAVDHLSQELARAP